MKKLILIAAALLTSASFAFAEEKSNTLSWDRLPDLPDTEGFAGAFAGVVHDANKNDDYLIVAGGANFPEGRPWEKEKNPKKIYYKSIYRLKLTTENPEWELLPDELPHEVGYGMSVTLPRRGSTLFIGGKHQEAFADVWEIGSDSTGAITCSPRVKLDLPLAEGTVGLIGEKVVVAGGVTNRQGGGFEPVQKAYMLDTSKEEGEWKWESLPWPKMKDGTPARGRAYAVSAVKGDKFYLFGGRDQASSDEPAPERVHQEKLDILSDCHVLELKTGTWQQIADLPQGMSAAPSAAIPVGVSHFLMLGGVSADYWRQQFEDRPELNGAGDAHPGFDGTVWAYDSITDTWVAAETLPAEVKDLPAAVPVTTPVVFYGNKEQIILPTGEMKPGIRTPQILVAEVEEKVTKFGMVNWIVVGIYLLGMVGIGYWFMWRKASATTEAYFRGGQKVPSLVAGLSIFATVLSSITFMSIPAKAYATDISWYIGQTAMLLIVPIVVFCYLPFFRKLDLTSAYMYLERRFSLAARLFGSLSFIVLQIGRIAIVLYLPALALAAVSDISVNGAIIIVGILCMVYTVMGGIEAVVWTDAVQAVVLLAGAILCLFLVVGKVDGGFGAMMEVANTDAKLFQGVEWKFNIKDGTATCWVIFIALFFNSFIQYTAGQDVVQRYVTTRDIQGARRSLWTTMWMSVIFSMVFFLLGTALYVFYKSQPTLLDPAMTSTDAIVPFFIMQQLPVGVAGLIIAAVFAASQSSVSSSMNSIATAWTKDFDGRLFRPKANDQQYLFSAKVVVVVGGTLGIAVALWFENSGIENAFKTFLGITGLATGSLGGIFALGVFTKKGNATGAVAGAVAGIAAVAIVKFAKLPVTGILYALIGLMTCFVVGYVVSICTGRDEREGLSLHG